MSVLILKTKFKVTVKNKRSFTRQFLSFSFAFTSSLGNFSCNQIENLWHFQWMFFSSSAFVFLKKGKKRHIFLLLLLQCCIGTTWIRCNLTKSVSKSLKPWVSVPAHMFWDQTNNNTACVHRCWCCCYFSASWTAHQFASSSAAIRIVETYVHYCLRWIFSFGSVWFGFGCNGSSSDSSISSTRYRLMSGNSSKSRASERINTRFEGYTAKKYTNTENWLPYSPYSTLSNAL